MRTRAHSPTRGTGRRAHTVRRLALCAVVAATGSIVVASQAAPPASDQSRRAAERIRALQAEADALLQQERTVLGDLRRLEVERDLATERVREVGAETAAVEQELASTTDHLAALERARDEQAPLLRMRLVELYKLGAPGYARLLAGVDDLRDAGRAYRTIAALAALDRERARAHASTLDSLRRARDELAARQASLARLRDEQVRARAAADAAVRAHSVLVASIDARRDLNAQLSSELLAAQQKLERQFAGTGPSDVILPLKPFKGALDWPVAGRVSRGFGRRGFEPGAVPRPGIDIAMAPGTPVNAVHEGKVAYAAPFTGYGNLVILDHGGGAYSVYGYLDRIDVARGARVAKDQGVGTVGRAPLGSGALYFELRIDGRAVDPLQWLKGRP